MVAPTQDNVTAIQTPVVMYFDGLCEPTALSPTDKAWMAGFVDGEGCISITKQKHYNRAKQYYHRELVQIANTDRAVLELFSRRYGGAIRVHHNARTRTMHPAWTQAFVWVCPVATTRVLLTDILPYLKVKDAQARLVLEFIDIKRSFARSPGYRAIAMAITEQELAARETYVTQVRALNQRGTLKGAP